MLPILNIYRKYYGRRVTLYLLATFYAAMVAAGLVVEAIFSVLGLIPDERDAKVVETSITWNYTTVLNIVFLLLAAALVVRFLKTGGPAMLRMMEGTPTAHEANEPASDGAQVSAGRRDGPGEFSCPMHSEVTSDASGTCPKCGMPLSRA